MKLLTLNTEKDVEDLFQKQAPFGFFKAGSCHKTMQGFGVLQEALSVRELTVGTVKVVENRPVSNKISELTGIKHESPQFILVVDGKTVFDLDNWDITPEAVQAGLEKFLGKSTNSVSKESRGDVAVYANLLKKFVAGEIPEETFQKTWLYEFRDDANFRSKDEFELLNGLFGDVDWAIQFGRPVEDLRDKAEKLLSQLDQ